MNKRKKILLASNVAYWPSIGGSEMVLQRILEGVKPLFDRVIVFVPGREKRDIYNSIEIFPYTKWDLRYFALTQCPDIYFPNMIHSPITYENLHIVSKLCKKTIVNMIGGYEKSTKLNMRRKILTNAEKYSDMAIHVDPLSTEYFIDNAINPNINYKFISQGLDFKELNHYRDNSGKKNLCPYFVYAHNLWKWKAPDKFLNEIVAKASNLNFKIIASDCTGDYIKETLEISKKYQNVEVLLGLNRNQFLNVMASSCGIISTSIIEGAQPNILLEAGYLGLPYFSLCPGQNYGHYPHVEMFEGVSDLLKTLLEYNYDIIELKREQLQRARKYFSQNKFNWDDIIKQYQNIFSEMV